MGVCNTKQSIEQRIVHVQFGIIVLTTSAGIMTHEEARHRKLGGKVRTNAPQIVCALRQQPLRYVGLMYSQYMHAAQDISTCIANLHHAAVLCAVTLAACA